MRALSMAYSPCPNDTFMFCDVAAGTLLPGGEPVQVHLHDVETLNRLALAGTYDITKVSFRTYLMVRDRYRLLDAGAALGYGCGPLVVARSPLDPQHLAGTAVAVPGELTTAHLLLQLWAPQVRNKRFVPYDRVMDEVLAERAGAGVIIHESRFVYPERGLSCLMDLGAWWEQTTGLPIPLGCIIARTSLGPALIDTIESRLRQAILRSLADPAHTDGYVGQNAREIDPAVQRRHIAMFVNDFSVSLGPRGRAAVECLENKARQEGLIP